MVDTRIVELDNKSRKGTYLYLKEKGTKGRYYKLKTGEPVEYIKRYYTDRYKKTRKLKGTLKQYKKAYEGKATWKEYKISRSLKRQVQEHLKKISKRPTISEAIKTGLTQVTIKNVLKADQKTIYEAQKQLLQDLIVDEKLLETIAKRENTEKMKTRYENRIVIYDKEGKKVTEAVKYNTTPETTIEEIKTEFKEGQTIDYPEKVLRNLGFQVDGKTEETTIGKISMTITFRKGR